MIARTLQEKYGANPQVWNAKKVSNILGNMKKKKFPLAPVNEKSPGGLLAPGVPSCFFFFFFLKMILFSVLLFFFFVLIVL